MLFDLVVEFASCERMFVCEDFGSSFWFLISGFWFFGVLVLVY